MARPAPVLARAHAGERSRQVELTVELTVKAGCLALNRAYRYFNQQAQVEPLALLPPGEPIADPARADSGQVLDELTAAGMLVLADRAGAWQHYRRHRETCHAAADFLARLTMMSGLKAV